MIKEVKTIAFFCDCCGRQMKVANNANVYEDRIVRADVEDGWYMNFYTHKYYCPNCWKLEERVYVVTKDGKEFEYEY